MANGRQKRVLVVDDDRGTAEALVALLSGEGYEADAADSATAGLEKARSEKPDLILLDVMMPTGTEGFHFVWELRRDPDPQCRNTPIIILSAIHQRERLRFYPDQSDGVYGPYEYLPVQAFLDKPTSSQELISEVRRVIEQASTSGSEGAEAGSYRVHPPPGQRAC